MLLMYMYCTTHVLRKQNRNFILTAILYMYVLHVYMYMYMVSYRILK